MGAMKYQWMSRVAAVLSCFVGWNVSFAADEASWFPLMAWNAAPDDPAALKQMRECGLTVAGFVNPAMLDACHAAGLKAIVSDSRANGYDWANVDENVARTNIVSLVAAVGKHPALYGYYLIDEPNSRLFPGLSKVSRLIRELSPGKWAYINLFPNYASREQLGTQTYEEYVEACAAQCQPLQLSYDHYALMDDGSLRHGYWQNLEQMRAAALKHGVPFWNIVLAVAHFNYREVTSADMRFQVYSTLAYGGKGISYFTYFAPIVGNYRMAAVDQFGNKTATWDHLRNINLQVRQLAPTLLKLKSDDVYHFAPIPDQCHGPSANSLVKDIGGKDIMAGDFTHEDGSRYVMLVNRDVVKSHYCAPIFTQAPKKVSMISPYTGQWTGFAGENTWLAPGQGVLLKLE
jgi:hypothetical protein